MLVIDEAQNMPMETLHHLHLLSNLETDAKKLIQIVLSGQPEFEDKLNSVALRQLKQRIAIKVRIVPLTRKDSLEYIRFRLDMAGHGGSSIFTTRAIRRITFEAAGIPRVINTLCDNCLITAFGKQQRRVTAATVREIIADFGGTSQAETHLGLPCSGFRCRCGVRLVALWQVRPCPCTDRPGSQTGSGRCGRETSPAQREPDGDGPSGQRGKSGG